MTVFLSGGATGGSITSELCCKVGEMLYKRRISTIFFLLSLPTSLLFIIPDELISRHPIWLHATIAASSIRDVKPRVLSFSAGLRLISLGPPRLLFASKDHANVVLGC